MKLRFLFISFLLVIVGLFVESSPTVNAQEIVPTTTQLVIHNGQLLDMDGRTDGKDTTFQVYDLSNQYQISSDPTSLKQYLAGKDAVRIQSYIRANHLSLITTVKTNNNGQAPNVVLNQDVIAVLIVQTGDSYNQNGDKVFAQPTVITLPVKDDTSHQQGVVNIFVKATVLPGDVPPIGPSHPEQPHSWLPTTGQMKRQTFWIGIFVILISGVIIIYLRREKRTNEN
jgi:hypothetical protein